ncbi:MAG: nucleotidyltransferase domain-containing protein [bacterium]
MKTIDEIPLTENEREILRKIQTAVKEELPEATVIFFGSRARGEPQEYSDWDILILAEKVTPEIKERIYDALYEVELEKDIIIGPLMLPRDEWEHRRFKEHPIHERVDEEGVLV